MLFVFQRDTARAGHGAAVDHHVTGQQQAGLTVGPGLVQLLECLGRRLMQVRHVLFHRGLGDAVGNDLAVGQLQRFER
ncbi:hypothetical protein E1K68_13085 [Pseudomonas sp. B2021]|nr:hypothetical protein [Pseudomonas sp. B2021]